MELVAERYRRVIAGTSLSLPDRELKVTVSLGLAWVPAADQTTQSSIIDLADSAIYAAKDAGRNQLRINVLEMEN